MDIIVAIIVAIVQTSSPYYSYWCVYCGLDMGLYNQILYLLSYYCLNLHPNILGLNGFGLLSKGRRFLIFNAGLVLRVCGFGSSALVGSRARVLRRCFASWVRYGSFVLGLGG